MFSLAAGVLRWLLQQREVRVLLVGLDGSGKTTLALQLKALSEHSPSAAASPPSPRLPPVRPTAGFQLLRLRGSSAAARSLSVLLWEVGGASALRPVWCTYAAEADVTVFCVDASSPERLPEAGVAFADLLAETQVGGASQELGETQGVAASPLRVLVFATKQDQSEALPPEALLAALLRFAAKREREARGVSAEEAVLTQRLRRRVLGLECVSAKDARSSEAALQAAVEAAFEQQLFKTKVAASLLQPALDGPAVETALRSPLETQERREDLPTEAVAAEKSAAVRTPEAVAVPPEKKASAPGVEERASAVKSETQRTAASERPPPSRPSLASSRRVLYEVDLSVGALNALLCSQHAAASSTAQRS